MTKQKRKLTRAEKERKRRNRELFMTIFIRGKMKRVRRPQMTDGLSEKEFIAANADPIWLHQHEMWEYIQVEPGDYLGQQVDVDNECSERSPSKDDDIPF